MWGCFVVAVVLPPVLSLSLLLSVLSLLLLLLLLQCLCFCARSTNPKSRTKTALLMKCSSKRWTSGQMSAATVHHKQC